MVESVKNKKFLTASDVARIFGVHFSTVGRWIKAGHLKGTRIGRRYLIPREEVEKKLKEAGIEV